MFHIKSIRTKLILGCIILSIVPIIIVTTVLYNISGRIIHENTAEAILLNLDSYAEEIDDIFMSLYYDTVEMAFDKQLRSMIKEDDSMGISNYLRDYLRNHAYIDSIYFFDNANNDVITSDENKQIVKVENIQNIDKRYDKKNGSYLINVIERFDYLSNKNYFTIEKALYDSEGGELLGYIQVNVDERTLYYDLLNDMIRLNNGDVLMINSDKVIVSSKRQEDIGDILSKENDIDFITTSKGYSLEEVKEESILKVYSVSKVTKYKLIYYIPEAEIIQDVKKINYIALYSIGISVILIVALWYFYTADLYTPIAQLKDQMLKVGEGDFDIYLEHDREDEMGILINGFNDMIAKVNYLFNEVFRTKYQKKEAELKALQSQITPHFLYNTLNSIRCVAILHEDNAVSQMLESLIDLLRATAGNKNVFIRLEQELSQVEDYVDIIRFRYNDAFKVIYDIEPEAYPLDVPKLIIQPLVENSIQHGLDLRSNEGEIYIKASKDGNNLVIKVIDNGRGISEEEIHAIQNNEEDKSKNLSGIGVYNVDERIKLYYGDEYGLAYQAHEGGGTEAIITLPSTVKRGEVSNDKGTYRR
ncbi:sensor histidine kinase [Vallitalea okinawensis]|uniref:sensor histidine kinase n=1 Tax=Vallitalea okinawensis TaxID=2078660 RepID=UPI000CFC5099|nr:sensor histidine kinase [Vallitalea okinawensis]